MNIEEAINTSLSMAEAARKLDIPFTSFKRKAGDLYTPNQSCKGIIKKDRKPKHETCDIINGLTPNYNRRSIKRILIKEGYLKNICYDCGLCNIWNGKPIILHLDHINGINNDNRLVNLRLLCPNCHSQTDTYTGRNTKRKNIMSGKTYKPKKVNKEPKIKKSRPSKFVISKEDLEALIKVKTYTEIGKMFGVSDNAIKKRCKKLGIVLENRLGYWTKVKHGKL